MAQDINIDPRESNTMYSLMFYNKLWFGVVEFYKDYLGRLKFEDEYYTLEPTDIKKCKLGCILISIDSEGFKFRDALLFYIVGNPLHLFSWMGETIDGNLQNRKMQFIIYELHKWLDQTGSLRDVNGELVNTDNIVDLSKH